VGAGYAFGNVPVIKNNFSLVAIGIVAVSVMPIFIEFWRSRRQPASKVPRPDASASDRA
jgi:membrane-associated protein